MNYTEYTAPLVEFLPNKSYRGTTEKISQGCQSEPIRKKEAATCIENTHVSIQCDLNAGKSVSSAGLSEFLAKVYPVMHKELSLPLTPIYWPEEIGHGPLQKTDSLYLDQSLSIANISEETLNGKRLITAWVSVSPLLIALAVISPDHNLYCDHATEHVQIISENTAKNTLRIPVRACVTVLYADRMAKNVLIAGTILGDIYVWKLCRQAGGVYSYEELYYQAGDGMIATLKWFESRSDKAMLLISGQIDGRINTWIYDTVQERVTASQAYSIDKSGNPIQLIAPISETSFCVYRRGSPLVVYDLNSFNTSKETNQKLLVLSRGKTCKGIDPLMEITRLEYNKTRGNLVITGKQGDIYTVKINEDEPELNTAMVLYRVLDIHVKEVFLMPNQESVICLNSNGGIESYEVNTGIKTAPTTHTTTPVHHINISCNGDHLLAVTTDGVMQIYTIVAN